MHRFYRSRVLKRGNPRTDGSESDSDASIIMFLMHDFTPSALLSFLSIITQSSRLVNLCQYPGRLRSTPGEPKGGFYLVGEKPATSMI